MAKLFLVLLLALTGCAATTPETAFKSERLTVQAAGAGPDVILIAGLGSSPRIWDETVAALPGYRCHLVHVAGFAGAPALANADGPLLGPLAEEIARYIRIERLNRPALVGHSMGGMLALMVAARRPELPSRVMVVDMPPVLAPMIGGVDATVASVRPFAEQARQQIASAASSADRARVAEMVVGTTARPEARVSSLRYWLASDPRVTSQGMFELFTTDLRPELHRIAVPLTVLWATPERSPLSAEQAELFYQAAYAGAPNRSIKRIADSHHLIMLDQPQRFQQELRTFLEGGDQ